MPRYALIIFLGTLAAFYQNSLPDVYWSSLTPVLLFFACFNIRYRLFLLLIATWLWSCGIFHYHLEHRIDVSADGQILQVTGRIADIVEVEDRRIRFEFKPEKIENYEPGLPRLLRVSWYQTETVPRAGERWQFELKLKQPGGYLNPGGFDYQAWQFARGIDGSGYVRSSEANHRLDLASPLELNRWRGRLADAIERACTDCTYQGLIQALVLGYRGNIDSDHGYILRATGTAHLLVISGLHIGLVAGLFFILGRIGWRLGFAESGCARNQFASLASLFGAIVYAAMAGFSLPTVRALIMLAVLLLAFLCRQRLNLANSIALALIVILIFDPRAVGSTSLWLSLSALLIIACAQLRLVHTKGWWRQLIVLQLFFSAFTLPLGLFIFDQATPAGFIANLVAIPLISFIVLPISLLTSLLAIIDADIASPVFYLLDRILSWLMAYLNGLIDSGFGSFSGLVLPVPMLFAAIPVLFIWLLPASPALRRAALVLAAVLISWQPSKLEPGVFRLDVLDVGMGTSIVLQTRSHSLIYDFGPGNRRGFSAADWTLVPFLQARRIGKVDLMIVSHVDQDHSGGFVSFIEDLGSIPILSGTPDEFRYRFALQQPVKSCHSTPPWRWDGVEFRFLQSGRFNAGEGTNNRSCVLFIQGHHRALMPGDIEIEQEARLVAEYRARLEAEILVAPHHGSNTSSSNRFIRHVIPDHVVFTVSRNNRWGFPHPAVERRYAALGSLLFRTDEHGSVGFVSRKDELIWQAMRDPPRRIWRQW